MKAQDRQGWLDAAGDNKEHGSGQPSKTPFLQGGGIAYNRLAASSRVCPLLSPVQVSKDRQSCRQYSGGAWLPPPPGHRSATC